MSGIHVSNLEKCNIQPLKDFFIFQNSFSCEEANNDITFSIYFYIFTLCT